MDFRNEDHEEQIERRPEPTSLEEMLNRIVESGGWSRYLDVKRVPGSRLWQIVSVPAAGVYRGNPDLIVTVSEQEFDAGTLSYEDIRAECRRYVLSQR